MVGWKAINRGSIEPPVMQVHKVTIGFVRTVVGGLMYLIGAAVTAGVIEGSHEADAE